MNNINTSYKKNNDEVIITQTQTVDTEELKKELLGNIEKLTTERKRLNEIINNNKKALKEIS